MSHRALAVLAGVATAVGSVNCGSSGSNNESGDAGASDGMSSSSGGSGSGSGAGAAPSDGGSNSAPRDGGPPGDGASSSDSATPPDSGFACSTPDVTCYASQVLPLTGDPVACGLTAPSPLTDLCIALCHPRYTYIAYCSPVVDGGKNEVECICPPQTQ
jgi:hypothetical protein